MIELLHERPRERLVLQGLEDGGQGERARVTRILVAGCQAELQRVLRINLSATGCDVTAARTGREALALAAHRLPEAVILDLSLPDIGGPEVIAKLRRWYQAPIIALSSQTSPAERIGALDAGADHYLTKPFAMDELMARLRAALRRDRGSVIHGEPQMIIGRWQVDLIARRVTRADTAAPPDAAEFLRLTPTEWAILEQLLQRPGQLVDGTQLLTSVWGPG
jgi:two-component system KDP operon response regulator KdpE